MKFLSRFPVPYSASTADRIDLLIVQPTPFCNIDCDYCYLPDRNSTARLERETFRRLLGSVADSGLVKESLSIVWHAGEPLVLPVECYGDLFSSIHQVFPETFPIRHSIQTNGMLLSERWCDFIVEHAINIGVSLDGPAFLHDCRRRDRSGRGTHERAMKGVNLLRSQRIDFHVIAVVTAESLAHADEIFDFFLEIGVERLGFNVEELEGENRVSSLGEQTLELRVRKFWERLFERQRMCGGRVKIREFEQAYNSIVHGRPGVTSRDSLRQNSLVAPFGIVAMDCRGNLSTFSPELLGAKSIHYGDFVFGNVSDLNLRHVLSNARFKAVARDIAEGVRLCERSCEYFQVCGGGAPSNKYFENKTFASTETMYCRTTIQMPVDVVLADLERRISGGSETLAS